MSSRKRKGKFKRKPSPDERKKKWILSLIIVGLALLVIMLGVLLSLLWRERQQHSADLPAFSSDSNSAVQTNSTSDSSDETKETSTLPSDTIGTTPSVTQPPVLPTQPVQTNPPVIEIILPYTIPGTNLVILRVAPYDGIYLEDGRDTSVTNVAMALLYNAGPEAVEYAEITMKYGDKTLQFEISAIPAGGKVVTQEISKSSCAEDALLECKADIAVREKLEKVEEILKVQDNGDNSLTITNLTDQELVTVRIFYKYYMEDEDVYVGGITYTAKISGLQANASVVITPSHYASAGSLVVMVRAYDTDV